jgi:hypothetical protein
MHGLQGRQQFCDMQVHVQVTVLMLIVIQQRVFIGC